MSGLIDNLDYMLARELQPQKPIVQSEFQKVMSLIEERSRENAGAKKLTYSRLDHTSGKPCEGVFVRAENLNKAFLLYGADFNKLIEVPRDHPLENCKAYWQNNRVKTFDYFEEMYKSATREHRQGDLRIDQIAWGMVFNSGVKEVSIRFVV